MACCHETDSMKSTPCGGQAQRPALVLTCMFISTKAIYSMAQEREIECMLC